VACTMSKASSTLLCSSCSSMPSPFAAGRLD
jgi:hypothetical protein